MGIISLSVCSWTNPVSYTHLDLVLESFEHSVYQVKKQTFSDVDDWEQLLDHLSEDRLEEIKNNPRGHGDLLIKELIWIRNYEEKWMKK